MHVCPKCGYREPPIWLNHQFQQHVSYARVEDFEEYYPDLAKQIRKGGYLTSDKNCYYRRSTKGAPYIHRWIKEYGPKGYHLDYEKAPIKQDTVDQNQKTIKEYQVTK